MPDENKGFVVSAATLAEVMEQDKHDEPDVAEIENVDYRAVDHGDGNADA